MKMNKAFMSSYDAARLLKVSGVIKLEVLQNAYKTAYRTYLPEFGGSKKMMDLVNEAFEVLKKQIAETPDKNFDFSSDKHEQDYAEDLNKALNIVMSLEGVKVEVVGAWIWVSGETRQHKDKLGKNGAGFLFAPKKKMWYFRPKNFKSRNRDEFSMKDIREKYNSVIIKDDSNDIAKAS